MSHGFRHLDLVVTEACNLACRYCFASQRSGRSLEPAAARRSIEWLVESTRPRLHITFWGGEPLLELTMLRELVPFARELSRAAGKEITFSLPTNATLLSEATLRWLAENQVRVFLSIDGDAEAQADRPHHDGRSSHRLARRGLELALAAPFDRPVTVRLTVTPHNAARLLDNVVSLEQAGARDLLICPAYDLAWSEPELGAFAAAQLALARWLLARLGEGESPLLRTWRPILRALERRQPLRTADSLALGCGAGRELLAVGVDGSLYPCHRFVFYDRRRDDETQIGRRTEAGFELAAGDPCRFAPRAGELRGRVACTECAIFGLCTLGCVAVNTIQTGDPRTVPPHACDLMHAQIAACRLVHERLAGDPSYSLYLGSSRESLLRRASRRLMPRAWQHYESTRRPETTGRRL